MKPGQRVTIEVEGGYILRTYRGASGYGVEYSEKFIPKKKTDQDQSLEGWIMSKKRSLSLKAHYFLKNDSISLCGNVRITSNNVVKNTFKPQCGQCLKVIKTYTDLNNFHGHVRFTHGSMEW